MCPGEVSWHDRMVASDAQETGRGRAAVCRDAAEAECGHVVSPRGERRADGLPDESPGDHAGKGAHSVTGLVERVADLAEPIKPRLRGWLLGSSATPRPRRHLPDHRRHLHPSGRAPPPVGPAVRAAVDRLHGSAGRHRVPGPMGRSSAPAVHPVLPGPGLGAGELPSRLPAYRWSSRSRPDRCRWSPVSAGAVVYALQRPDPSPRWFRCHEVFHALTVAAFTAHYAAISLATY